MRDHERFKYGICQKSDLGTRNLLPIPRSIYISLWPAAGGASVITPAGFSTDGAVDLKPSEDLKSLWFLQQGLSLGCSVFIFLGRTQGNCKGKEKGITARARKIRGTGQRGPPVGVTDTDAARVPLPGKGLAGSVRRAPPGLTQHGVEGRRRRTPGPLPASWGAGDPGSPGRLCGGTRQPAPHPEAPRPRDPGAPARPPPLRIAKLGCGAGPGSSPGKGSRARGWGPGPHPCHLQGPRAGRRDPALSSSAEAGRRLSLGRDARPLPRSPSRGRFKGGWGVRRPPGALRRALYGSPDGAAPGRQKRLVVDVSRGGGDLVGARQAAAGGVGGAGAAGRSGAGKSGVQKRPRGPSELRRSRDGFHVTGEQEAGFRGSPWLLHMTLFHHFGGRRIFPRVCIREYDPFICGWTGFFMRLQMAGFPRALWLERTPWCICTAVSSSLQLCVDRSYTMMSSRFNSVAPNDEISFWFSG
nr:spidroin-1-like [Saimiri boliviensis boliviensis]